MTFMKNPNIIYCDFDGTVTKEDSVNKFLAEFADAKWLDVEEQWIRGDIGSKECLSRQVELLRDFSSSELDEYVDSIQIDETFVDFCETIKQNGWELIIVSDGFDFFIERILKKYGLDIPFFANTLTLQDNKLHIDFNFSDSFCPSASGMCKCARTTTEDFCYIGDGLSDVCIAAKAKLLFAKNSLQKYCEKEGMDYVSFNTFEDILDYFSQKGDLNAKFSYINN